jgi:peptidoglycan/xylan/chitin deacetylase (PgdA/CDA1 family)
MKLLGLEEFLFPGSHRVLYLHRVGEAQSSFYPKGISVEFLEEVLLDLKRKGYRFTSLVEALHSGKGRTISLSSDDGFACNYASLMPLLRKHNIPLTLFLIGTCVDNRALAWNHKLLLVRSHAAPEELESFVESIEMEFALPEAATAEARIYGVANSRKDELADLLWERFCPLSQAEYLRQYQPFLSAEQLQELSREGVEIALHSQTHADFSRLSFEEMQQEIRQNRLALNELNLPVKPCFSLPYGRQVGQAKLAALCKTEEIELCLGTYYSLKDNRLGKLLWQRQPLELSPAALKLELWLRPWVRAFRKEN